LDEVYTQKYYMQTWCRIKSDGGCFAGCRLLRCSRKTKGVGGTIKLNRRTINLFKNAVSNVQNSVYM
jgi:hypothetical protein